MHNEEGERNASSNQIEMGADSIGWRQHVVTGRPAGMQKSATDRSSWPPTAESSPESNTLSTRL